MEEISVFTEIDKTPDEGALRANIGEKAFQQWAALCDFVFEQYPKAKAEWKFSGVKYGWSFSIKDKKRAIIYFLPRQLFFKVAFVFGQKAYDVILNGDFPAEIQLALSNAPKYAEGRGIRLPIGTSTDLDFIKRLIKVKLSH